MKRIHILLMALVALSIQGCQDDFDVPSEQASRSYEQDAEVLNRFVDINKTTHEYYINPNKRTTALSYITNADAEELAVVNSLNLDVFQQSIDRVGKLSGQFASNHGVDYVVMMTGNEVYVSRTKSDSPRVLERMNERDVYKRQTYNIPDKYFIMRYMRCKIERISDYSITFVAEMSYLNAIHSITQQIARLPSHYLKNG